MAIDQKNMTQAQGLEPLDFGLTDERAGSPQHRQVNTALPYTGINYAPIGGVLAISVEEEATTANLWAAVLAVAVDPDYPFQLTITAVDDAGTDGTVALDTDAGTLTYEAPAAAGSDSFEVTVQDFYEATATVVVNVTVTEAEE